MTTPSDESRAEFEAWHIEKFPNEERPYWSETCSGYIAYRLIYRYQGWNAARTAPPASADEWTVIDRIIVEAYDAGLNGDEFNMLKAKESWQAARTARYP